VLPNATDGDIESLMEKLGGTTLEDLRQLVANCSVPDLAEIIKGFDPDYFKPRWILCVKIANALVAEKDGQGS